MDGFSGDLKTQGIPAEEIDVPVLRALYRDNRELFKQIELPLISCKYTKTLPSELLARVVCDKEFQHKILALQDNEYNLFIRCLQTAKKHGANLVTAADMLVNGLKNPQFSELITECLKEQDGLNIDNLNILLNQEENYFEIKTVVQLNNYQAVKNLKCKKILQNPGNEKLWPDPLKKMPAEERVKFAQCEKEFGISLSQAKLLCQKYG